MRVELDCIAMRDADERALQWWRTDVLQQETELHCNDGGQICCNRRPSRVAMMADEYVTMGDRVASCNGGRRECCNGSKPRCIAGRTKKRCNGKEHAVLL